MLGEPTNDLDTDTLASMEDLLDTFPGTLVVVSHDRYLLERVTDHQVALLGDGTLRALPGGVEQYLALRAEGIGGLTRASSPDPLDEGARGTSPAAGGAGGDRNEGVAPAATPSDSQVRRAAKKEADRLERRLQKLRGEVSEVEDHLAEVSGAIATDASRVPELQELSERLAALNQEVDEAETDWLEAAERME